MPDVTDQPDNPNRFMDDRLDLQALKNKRYLDKTLEFDFYQKIDKRELLEMLLKSTTLMIEASSKIAEQRSQIVRFQMDKINSL